MENKSHYQNLDLKGILYKISNNNLHAYTNSKYKSLLSIRNQLENIINDLQLELKELNKTINQIN